MRACARVFGHYIHFMYALMHAHMRAQSHTHIFIMCNFDYLFSSENVISILAERSNEYKLKCLLSTIVE